MKLHLKYSILIVFYLTTIKSQAQTWRTFKSVSSAEKWWGISHVFVAKKTFYLSKSVLVVCDSLKKNAILQGSGNGDQLDAFRHTYWMALLTQNINPKKALKLGIAHEKGNYQTFKNGNLEDGATPDSMSTVMDLMNNKTGLEIGKYFKQHHPKQETNLLLIQTIIDSVKQSKVVTLKKDLNKNFLTCDEHIIDLNLYKGKWSIPKCLIKSGNPNN